MQKLFNNILVPLDFSPGSNAAVEKAIDLAKHYKCGIHLLYVSGISSHLLMTLAEGKNAMPLSAIDNKKEIEFQLEKICANIYFLTANTVNVKYHIAYGAWNQSIVDFTALHNIDLILIGQKGRFLKKRKMVLNPDFIAEHANIPVITIPSNRRLTRLYSIIIPVTDFLPVRKLMYGVYMAANFNSTIKLLGIENAKTKDYVQHYLAKASDLIKEHCSVNVETEIIAGTNVAEAVSQFAMMKSADLIIINPGMQSKMPGFFSSFINNIIQKYSVPPVLTVNRV